MSKNNNLHKAKSGKNDEFYTQLEDIERECSHYREHFKDKVVFCNCDDPFESNFFKYFVLNFSFFGLKKLICTCYEGSSLRTVDLLTGEETEIGVSKKAYKCIITNTEGINSITLVDVKKLITMTGNALEEMKTGDFRSDECVQLLKESDVVVTNPPFSLFREYIAQLVEYDKKFLVIGNMNAITYKEIFPLIKDNKMWLGLSITSGDRKFNVPDNYPLNAAGCGIDATGKRYIRVKGVRWFTNLEHNKRHQPLDLYKKYSSEEFPKYDNYDAININKTADIPYDYEGVMGVPITFLDKYCPEQFEIVDARKYTDSEKLKNKTTYLVKDADGSINGKATYARILIRHLTH